MCPSMDTPRVALLIITDGRTEYLAQTLASAADNLPLSRFVSFVLVNDSGSSLADDHPLRIFRELLNKAEAADADFEWLYIAPKSGKRGFAGAIQAGWAAITGADRVKSLDRGPTHVFHLEDDFTFNEPVDIDGMALVLEDDLHVAQVALQRQPVNDVEAAAGGVIAMWPDEYAEHEDVARKLRWCEHDLFFTTNPSLYRATLPATHPWPSGARSEEAYTAQLRAAGYRFAFWGAKTDPPKVHHIGEHRTGTGY